MLLKIVRPASHRSIRLCVLFCSSKFSAMADLMTPDDVLQQVQAAAKFASEELAQKYVVSGVFYVKFELGCVSYMDVYQYVSSCDIWNWG